MMLREAGSGGVSLRRLFDRILVISSVRWFRCHGLQRQRCRPHVVRRIRRRTRTDEMTRALPKSPYGRRPRQRWGDNGRAKVKTSEENPISPGEGTEWFDELWMVLANGKGFSQEIEMMACDSAFSHRK